MRVWSRDLGEPGISAAQEEGRLAVTLHGCTPLVLASQTVPRLPRPSASRHAHDPAIANLIQRASSFPYNEARVLVLTERRRIETSGRRLCEPPYDPASCPTLQDRFRRTSSPFSVSTDTSRRMCHATKGNRPTNARFSSMKEMLCVMDGYDAPIGRFSP